MTATIELDSARLRLRQWADADRSPFAELNADPLVMQHFPAPLTQEQSDAMADRCQSRIAANGWGFWAAELKVTGQFIGFVGLNTPIAELPFSPCVEIGWRLARPFWGRGLATEGARAALDYGFDLLQLPEIVAFTALGNDRSRAVMERLGMRQDGEFDHPLVPRESGVRRHLLYRLKREYWDAGKKLRE
jgi:RimJ/RimL family protein N-acetyltransferase